MNRRLPVLAIALVFCGLAARAATPLQEKNFPLLSMIEATPAVAKLVTADPDLNALRRDKARFQFSEPEIESGAAALRRLYGSSAALRELVDGPLRRSHTYVRYESKPGADLLAAAWSDAARAIDNIIEVYGNGKAPRYPAIDSVSFDVKSDAYVRLLQTVTASLEEEDMPLFFQPSLRYALQLLQINHRDEAVRHPGIDAAVAKQIKSIEWSRFPWSVIVVPGFGPEKPGLALAPEGRLRIELAARRFHQKKAPLIMVSGGYVHPNQTPYCEAIEMKNALVSEFGVPAEAVIVEPYARHTTTNLRNASRLMHQYGIPFDRPALITTDTFQSSYIESEPFTKRCDQELGYQPTTLRKRVSAFDLEFTPRLESLQVDAMDPLDP